MADLLERTDHGLYCPRGRFYVDPWRPVDRAIVTHAHADHLRWGCKHYLVAAEGLTVTRARLSPTDSIQTAPYGKVVNINGVKVSFHPAGHILGSAQVRVESGGEVWVVSGDYKTDDVDPTCAPFAPVQCHTFITESTFGLPIYRWPASADLYRDINAWWRANAAAGKASIAYGYSLGKSQRILAGVDPGIGPIYTHGAVEKLTQAYRDAGVAMPPTQYAGVMQGEKGAKKKVKRDWAGSLIVAPPSTHGTPWMRKFAPSSAAFCSGWMQIRGTRRRKAVDRGFVMSDHADWPGLLWAIKETGCTRVGVTHGYTAVLSKYLRDQGYEADIIETRYEGEPSADGPIEGEDAAEAVADEAGAES